MNGHDRRKQRLIDHIKKTALELFTTLGADNVCMDEIAAKAHVSKVTIYKYFHSKEELYRAVVDLYIDEILIATEKVLDSDLDFFEKLKFTLLSKLDSPKMANSQPLFELFEKYGQNTGGSLERLQTRIKEIMFRFYQQGKKEGYIAEGVPFEILYLYSEIFQSGFKAKSIELEPVLADPQAFDQLLNAFYFGVFRKK